MDQPNRPLRILNFWSAGWKDTPTTTHQPHSPQKYLLTVRCFSDIVDQHFGSPFTSKFSLGSMRKYAPLSLSAVWTPWTPYGVPPNRAQTLQSGLLEDGRQHAHSRHMADLVGMRLRVTVIAPQLQLPLIVPPPPLPPPLLMALPPLALVAEASPILCWATASAGREC